MSESSQSPVVVLFTRRKSNKLQKDFAEHAVRIQSLPETNRFCLKFELAISVLT